MKLKKIVMLLLFGVVAFFYFKTNPSRVDFLLKCPLYCTTGIYCPGCGSQRAFHSLLHGNFTFALQNNIMLIIGIIGLLYHYGISLSNSFFKTNFKSSFNNRKVVLTAIGVLILFWILRNIPHYPFTFLAPAN